MAEVRKREHYEKPSVRRKNHEAARKIGGGLVKTCTTAGISVRLLFYFSFNYYIMKISSFIVSIW